MLTQELKKIDDLEKRLDSEDLLFKLDKGEKIDIFTLFELDCLTSGILVTAVTRPELYCEVQKVLGKQNYQKIMYQLLLQYQGIRQRIESYAKRDPLTNLYNRTAFDALLDANIALFLQGKIPDLAQVMFDIDFFKKVNDTLGHAKGDEVLRGTCTVLQETFRDPEQGIVTSYHNLLRDYLLNPGKIQDEKLRKCIVDLFQKPIDFGTLLKHKQLGRFGGEEIVAVFPGVGLGEAYRLANGIRARVKRYFSDLQVGERKGLTLSGGIQTTKSLLANKDLFFIGTPAESEIRGELFRQMDATLYVAKESGRDKVLTFKNALTKLAAVRHQRKIAKILNCGDLARLVNQYR